MTDKTTMKIENASAAFSLLVTFLETHGAAGWAERFADVPRKLKEGNPIGAIKQYDLIPMASMGGFTDLVLSDPSSEENREINIRLHILHGKASHALSNLRVFLEYGSDRPTVDTSCEAIESEVSAAVADPDRWW